MACNKIDGRQPMALASVMMKDYALSGPAGQDAIASGRANPPPAWIAVSMRDTDRCERPDRMAR